VVECGSLDPSPINARCDEPCDRRQSRYR
jgi:hypothetical protein